MALPGKWPSQGNIQRQRKLLTSGAGTPQSYCMRSGAIAYLWQPNRVSSSDLQESTSRYHFLAFFVAAGVFSSLTSHLYTLAWKLPRMTSAILSGSGLAASGSTSILPSLGASGSIYATVVVTALGTFDYVRSDGRLAYAALEFNK